MNDQKVNQIMQALQMREEGEFVNGMRVSTPTIAGDERKTLITQLVKYLTTEV